MKYDNNEAHHRIDELEEEVAMQDGKIAALEALLKKAEATIVEQQRELSSSGGYRAGLNEGKALFDAGLKKLKAENANLKIQLTAKKGKQDDVLYLQAENTKLRKSRDKLAEFWIRYTESKNKYLTSETEYDMLNAPKFIKTYNKEEAIASWIAWSENEM